VTGLPGAKRFAPQGQASLIYRAKKILQANWLWVLRCTGHQAQVTADVSF
jgi:hypothetical protein